MAKEIERKFLVVSDSFIAQSTAQKNIRQGYLSTNPLATVRVRTVNQKGFLTIKSKTEGIARDEYEYEIPFSDAISMLTMCKGNIDKTRYIVPYKGLTWEVDVFEGRHRGLIVAEVELTDAHQEVSLPDFIGAEVTGDPAYYNSNLSRQ